MICVNSQFFCFIPAFGASAIGSVKKTIYLVLGKPIDHILLGPLVIVQINIMNFQTLTLKKHMFDIFSSHSFKSNYKYIILSDETIVCTDVKGTPGFIHCSFKVASLATLNKHCW